MNARGAAGRLLAGLTVLLLLAACASGVIRTSAPTSTAPTGMPSVPIATPTPTPMATRATVSHGPVTVVTGTATCPTVELGQATTDASGVTHYRGSTFACSMSTDDPRVTGTETASWNMDLWGSVDDGALVQWGPAHLDNPGGAWEGKGTGIYSSARGDVIVIWYKGTRGYAGLSYLEVLTGHEPWQIQGQIFPGDPPSP